MSQAANCISRLIQATLSLKPQAAKRQATVLVQLLLIDLLLCYSCEVVCRLLRKSSLAYVLFVHASSMYCFSCFVPSHLLVRRCVRPDRDHNPRAGTASHRCKIRHTPSEVVVQQKGNMTLWTGNSTATNSPLGKATWCSTHDSKAKKICMSCVVQHVALQPPRSMLRNRALRPSGGKRRPRGSTGPAQSHKPRPCQQCPQ